MESSVSIRINGLSFILQVPIFVCISTINELFLNGTFVVSKIICALSSTGVVGSAEADAETDQT